MKTLALIAHDGKKTEMVAWCLAQKERLSHFERVGTGHTARLVAEATGLPVKEFHPGPLGGDLEIGAEVTKGNIHGMLFFWDPLSAQPHDPDVKALLRIAVVYDVPIATNKATADLMIAGL